MSALSVVRSQAVHRPSVLIWTGSVRARPDLIQPAPGLAAAEHAAKGAALNPQAVRALQRDRGIIGAAGIRIENPATPFGILAGLHVDENLLTVLVRLRVHRKSAEIGAALFDSNLAFLFLLQPNARRGMRRFGHRGR